MMPTKIINCFCCPFGYHIDIDFVRYLEKLTNESLIPSDGQRRRRDKRRQRQSMIVMLGLDELNDNKIIDNIDNDNDNNNIKNCHFITDALNDVVFDFERTLEQQDYKKKKNSNDDFVTINNKSQQQHQQQQQQQQQQQHNIDMIKCNNVCINECDDKTININNEIITNDLIIKTFDNNYNNDRLSIISNGSDSNLSTGTLYNIREQMSISLKKMRILEEQVQMIPGLQEEIKLLKDEKKCLERKCDNLTIKLIKYEEQTQFPLPQRVNLITLNSMNNLLLKTINNENNENIKIINKKQIRDIGVMCIPLTRDVGISCNQIKTRTIGIDNNNDIYFKNIQKQYTYDEMRIYGENLLKNSIKINYNNIGIQTDSENTIKNKTIGIQCTPIMYDFSIQCIKLPKLRTIGISNDKITDKLCEKCSVHKRTIGTNINYDTFINYPVSLKTLDIPLSSTQTSNDRNLLNKFRTIGTQYYNNNNIGNTIGIQCTPISINKSVQHILHTNTIETDTNNLINTINKSIMTDNNKLINKSMNTNILYTNEQSSMTDDNLIKKNVDATTNTNIIEYKTIGCGNNEESQLNQKHITITCAVNYCDTCKDTIKNLAKDFKKLQTIIPSTDVMLSKIPRPKNYCSPRPERKLNRQNTYTIGSNYRNVDNIQGTNEINDKIIMKNDDTIVITPVCPAEAFLRLSTLDYNPDNNDFTKTNNNNNNNNKLLLDITSDDDDDDDNNDDIQLTINNTDIILLNDNNFSEIKKVSNDNLYNDIVASSNQIIRTKVRPTKEMMAALKVINDSLQKYSEIQHNIKNANDLVQKEWFNISSTDNANPHIVEDYLDCFEEFSNNLLKFIVNLQDINGNTAMHYAVSHGNFDIVSILVDSKVCNVNQINNAGYTCVMLVSLAKLKISEHCTVVQRLFQLSDVNIRAKKHCQTALMLAVSHGNIDMVQMLLEAGADINIQDEDGSTALMCAAEHGRIDIVKLLLAHPDCDSSIQDVDGTTALKISLEAGYRDIGVLLYAHEHMSRNKSPYTTLHRKNKKTGYTTSSTTTATTTTTTSPSPSCPSQKCLSSDKTKK